MYLNLWESIRVSLESIWANKLRSGLTMLGIIIGVAAVILVVSLGQGGQAAIMAEFERMGSNLFVVYMSYMNDDSVENSEWITLEDIQAIAKQIPEVKAVAPVANEYAEVESAKIKRQGLIVGTTANYGEIENLNLAQGHFFTLQDEQTARRIVVIDSNSAEKFFGKTNPIGQKVIVKNVPLTVVGVIKSEGGLMGGGGEQLQAMVPVKLWQKLFNTNRLDQIVGTAENKDVIQVALDRSLELLHRRHKNEDRYRGYNLEEQISVLNDSMAILTTIIGAIAGISLLVGGIGVMNIMLVSVTERTREIGLRMAIGARRKDILRQFLIEAVVICLVGGVIGMLLGIGGSILFTLAIQLPLAFSWLPIILAFSFSAVIGIFFGLYPANKAAKLDPIEALRYE